jgi:DNA replication protein DnaD
MLHTYLLPTSKFNVSKIHTSYDLKHTICFATSRLFVMELAEITNLMEYHILTNMYTYTDLEHHEANSLTQPKYI